MNPMLEQLGQLAYRDLTEAIDQLADLEHAAAHAEVAYRQARAHAYLAAEGSVALRDATADLACSDALLARRLAEIKARIQKERVRQIHARIETGRTIAATERRITDIAP